MSETLDTRPQFDYDQFELPENIALEFRLAPHFNQFDLPSREDLEARFAAADIIVPELVSNYGSGDVAQYAKIAQGDAKVLQKLKLIHSLGNQPMSGWFEAFQAALYNSRKPLAHIDINTRHPAQAKMTMAMRALSGFHSLYLTERQVEDSVRPLRLLHEAMKIRDQAILNNIKPVLEATASGDRRLATKREQGPLQVKLFYGTMHRPLVTALNAKNDDAPVEGFSAIASEDSSTRDPEIGFYEKYLNGQEWTLPEVRRHLAVSEVWERMLAEGIVMTNTMSYNTMLYAFDLAAEGLDYSEYSSTNKIVWAKLLGLIALAKEVAAEEAEVAK